MPQVDRIRDRIDDRSGEDRVAPDNIDGGRSGGGAAAPKSERSSSKPEVPIDQAAAQGPARHVDMTIIAQDPLFTDAQGAMVRAQVRVQADRFRKPFQTHRFNMVSFDPVQGGPGPELNLLGPDDTFVDRFANAPDPVLLKSDDFHAQNVLAIASRTLQAFEGALGRRVPWDFDTHQLFLVPHAEIRANAGYAQNKRAVLFGLVPHQDGTIRYSCLSHDVVAHEVTHAILDGLRSGFFTPSLPDQAAFHEGFADVVALLSVFAVPTVLDAALEAKFGKGPIALDDVSAEMLRESVLFEIAEQFGEEIHGRSGKPLRESLGLPAGDWWREKPGFDEPHNRGEILVAAIGGSMLDMWFKRLRLLLEKEPAPRPLLADEGAKAAEHLLRMAIRAIDYCPPVEFEFEDFLEALVVADREVAPDDEHGYVTSVTAGFKAFDIGFPPERVVEVSKLKNRPDNRRFNYTALQFDKDEVFRYVWENDELLGISLEFATEVDSVRPSIRVGPDGFVVRETVVTYKQFVDATAVELADLSNHVRSPVTDSKARLELPPTLDPSTPMRMYGGGALVFDQFGSAKYHQHKPLLDWPRQSRRLKYLAAHPDLSASTRLGAPLSFRIEPLAAAHRVDPGASERW